MSTQAAQSILFTHTAPQQSFRLLELPPDLADLLTSENPPTLHIKSPQPSSSFPTSIATSTPQPRDYINLCTGSKTYRIRQVQSSNSLHILQPSNAASSRIPEAELAAIGATQDPAASSLNADAGSDSRSGAGMATDLSETVTTISKCSSTLELHTPAEGFDAVGLLSGLVGVYDEVMVFPFSSPTRDRDADVDVRMDVDVDVERRKILERVFADLPVSRKECESAWRAVCGFVVLCDGEGGGKAWAPTARVKMGVWKQVLDGAVLQGINLGEQFLVRDLWGAAVGEENEGVPRGLFEAVVRRVWASVDKEECVRWVGETYLEAVAPSANSAVGRSEFLNAWKDRLPEAWREEAALSKLTEDKYRFPDPTTICFVNEVDRQKLKKNLSTDASASTAAKKTRNWHELFKNQKRQKR
ncbi:hypothetical protein BO70DRAFT_393529 [Aspergillus heteromorphus CBS 117.55]|uniref:Sister chromatid cohesion protein Dcc1 n=1 Tax=Aspergillus heteromorphus CBS 117.55 TaxID=1448321 RepID=A0A317WXU0_9EURO|nr:uncharacterized protein BO70DRAFT_393529 [Aspergillus heteromorphus CBS 117.55]PWY89010.1 hypothetical protein BO70DRAFT_393529 [Aspergillus heteromorphus CBS 117.55]